MKTLLITALALAGATMAQAQAPTDIRAAEDRAFAAMDANKDGQVSRAEYGKARQARFDRQSRAMSDTFGLVDKDKDGGLSKAEAAGIPVIAGAFDGLDGDRNGILSLAEMQEALAKSRAVEADQ